MARFLRLLGVTILLVVALARPGHSNQTTLTTPVAPLTMAGLASFLNAAFTTVATNYSGSTPPAVCTGGTACTYQFWLDTSTSPRVLRMYDGTQWVPFASLNTSTHSFVFPQNYISVSDYGAVGNGVTDDTAAFQAAANAATGSSGAGTVFVPPTTSCYMVSSINATNMNSVTFQGVGDQSNICINGEDAQGNWWDLSGSRNMAFSQIKISGTSGQVPDVAFLWACTGTSCGTSGVLSGLSFDHVTISAYTNKAILYGYGFGPVGGSAAGATNGGGSLNISNSMWTQRQDGAFSANPYERNSVVHLNGLNSLNIRSANVTLTSTAATVWGAVFTNSYLVEFGQASTMSNNTVLVLYNANRFVATGGVFQGRGDTSVAIWSNSEGITFLGPVFEQAGGSNNVVNYWVQLGGGFNTYVNFISAQWSAPRLGFIALDAGTDTVTGGTWSLNVTNSTVGLNDANAPFISKTANGCGPFVSTNDWIKNSTINFIGGADAVVSCGNIDAATYLQNSGTITLEAGAADYSFKLPGVAVDNASTRFYRPSSGTDYISAAVLHNAAAPDYPTLAPNNGFVTLGAAGTTATIAANVTSKGGASTSIGNTNQVQVLSAYGPPSGVAYVSVSGATTGQNPIILGTGEANTGLTLSTTGAGRVNIAALTAVAPILGTPTSVTLSNATGLPVSTGISGLGTGIATALAVNVGTAGAPVVNGGALGSPSSVGTLPALTLGGTISGAGNQINNVVIGASTPLAGSFTTLGASGAVSMTGTLATLVNSQNSTTYIAISNTNVGASASASFLLASNFGTFSFTQYSTAAGGSTALSAPADGSMNIDLPGATGGVWSVRTTNSYNTRLSVAANGQVTMPAAITSTSKTTGTLVVTGGVGISGASFTDTLNVITMANAATTSAVCYNTGTGLLTYNGTVGTCTVSDETKKNMGPRIANALAKVLAINGVSYTWKDSSLGTGTQIGVGAQTVERVFPELVSTDSSGLKSVDYQRLTAPLIEAIRELKADNDNLSARLRRVESARR